MRLVWLGKFELEDDRFSEMLVILEGWLRSARREPECPSPLAVGTFEFDGGGRLQIEQEPTEGEVSAWAMRYERRSVGQGVIWITDFSVHKADGRLRGVARLHVEAIAQGRPRLERIDLRPPGFIWEMRKRGLLGGSAFLVRRVSAEQVDDFARSVLSPGRESLMVAVAVNPYSESPSFDVAAIQDELVGIAEVALLDKQASLRLPRAFEKLGVAPDNAKKWGVYGGAVKVYRSSAAASDDPFDHPLWLPQETGKSDFAVVLKNWCWSLATLEPPPRIPDVATIREGRRTSQPIDRTADQSIDELAEIFQQYLSDEQARTEEQRKRADAEMTRAEELAENVRTLEAKVQALRYQLARKGGPSDDANSDMGVASEEVPGDADTAVSQARMEFQTLLIPENVVLATREDGEFWYNVLRALHELCSQERRGEVKNKRSALRDLLRAYADVTKDTYKVADTGVYIVNPETGSNEHLRERVHLREGKPAETESVYWCTIGDKQAEFRYLVGRIGRHV